MVFNKIVLSLATVSSLGIGSAAAQAASLNGFSAGGSFQSRARQTFDLTSTNQFEGFGTFKDAKVLGTPGLIKLKDLGSNQFDILIGNILKLDLAPKLDRKLDLAFNIDGFLNRTVVGNKSVYTGHAVVPLFTVKDPKELASVPAGDLKATFVVGKSKANWRIVYKESKPAPAKPVPEPVTLLGFGVVGVAMLKLRNKVN